MDREAAHVADVGEVAEQLEPVDDDTPVRVFGGGLRVTTSINLQVQQLARDAISKASAEVGETIQGESHAWIEAWTGGWWGHDPTNDIEIGHRSTNMALLGMLSLKLGRSVHWDGEQEVIRNDPEANQRLSRPYRQSPGQELLLQRRAEGAGVLMISPQGVTRFCLGT